MTELKYTVIKTEEQYDKYCDILEELVFDADEDKENEIDLLTVLIEHWDEQHHFVPELNPVERLKVLQKKHHLNQNELAEIAGVGKSYISEILNYKKKMSKKVIRNLAKHFKIRQEALNQPYPLSREHESAL